MFTNWKVVLTASCLAILCGAVLPVQGQEGDLDVESVPFGDALSKLADRIQQYVRERGDKKVFVEEIRVPNGSSGRQLSLKLKQLLGERNVGVVSEESEVHDWRIAGRVSSRGTEQRFANLTVQVLDADGNEIREFRDEFNLATKAGREAANRQLAPQGQPAITEGAVEGDSNAVAALLQVNVDVQTPVEQATQIKPSTAPGTGVQVTPEQKKVAQVEKTKAVARASSRDQGPHFIPKANGFVAASEASPFEVRIRATDPARYKELLAQSKGGQRFGDALYLPVAIEDRGGSPFANLQEGQFYCVDIINRSPNAVGVEIAIDGINALELCQVTEWKRAGKFVVNSGKMTTLYGWLVSHDETSLFELTSKKGEGVAESLGRVQTLGVVSATFFTARSPNDSDPAFEQLLTARSRSTELSTRLGPNVSNQGEVKSDTKIFGLSMLAQVAIRYRNPDPPADLPTDAASN